MMLDVAFSAEMSSHALTGFEMLRMNCLLPKIRLSLAKISVMLFSRIPWSSSIYALMSLFAASRPTPLER